MMSESQSYDIGLHAFHAGMDITPPIALRGNRRNLTAFYRGYVAARECAAIAAPQKVDDRLFELLTLTQLSARYAPWLIHSTGPKYAAMMDKRRARDVQLDEEDAHAVDNLSTPPTDIEDAHLDGLLHYCGGPRKNYSNPRLRDAFDEGVWLGLELETAQQDGAQCA